MLAVLLDYVTKWLAIEFLSDGDVYELFWTLQFRLVRNSGMAFSAGQNLGPLVGILVLFVVFFIFRIAIKVQNRIGLLAFGMLLGGAIGNLLDRIFRGSDGVLKGEVVDFVDFQWWPVFNVADALIVVGGLLLVINGLENERNKRDCS